MREKRTNIDFSKHKFNILKQKELNIFELKIPNSLVQRVRFTNTDSVCLVTGDFGHWVFCREFYPSKGGYVSSMYWIEKLNNIPSSALEYDSKKTYNEIQKLISEGLEEHGYENNELNKAKEFFKNLLKYTDDEITYKYEAYRSPYKPDFIEFYEIIPFCQTINYKLKIIFDAFEEMCYRLGKNER